VYAAAVVLWEALTGRRLFEAKSDAETLALVLAPKVVPPTHYVPSLPREAERVVMRGLSVDPAGRYPTAREMARALSHALPTANAHDVSEWVQSVAGEAMARRAEQVANIERSTPSPGDVFLRDPRTASQPPRESEPASEPSPPPVTAPSSESALVADPGDTTVGPPKRRRGQARITVFALAGLALVVAPLLLFVRQPSQPTHVETGPTGIAPAAGGDLAPAPSPTVTASSAPPNVVPPAPPTTAMLALPAVVVAASASASSAPARAASPVARPVHRVAPATAPVDAREDLEHVIDSRK
jgi:serine/threonine-protein kinase